MAQDKTLPQVWKWSASQSYDRADLAILGAYSTSNPLDSPPTLTRSYLKKLIEEGAVTVNGQPIKPNTKIKENDLVEINFPAPKNLELIPEDRPLQILFEDEHLLVVNKPPGLTVHPSSTQYEGTLVHALLHHVQDLSGIGGVLRPGIVHRIDKDTSGALVITKTDAAHTKLVEVFSKHQIERTYWALCYGVPPTSGRELNKIETFIGRNPKDRKKMSVLMKQGKKAISYYRVLEKYSLENKNPFASWVEVTLETGRTHQVRVHMTHLGHSLLGDPVYGTPSENQAKWKALPRSIQEAVKGLPGQALHARVLGFEHPITHAKLRFEAELPEAFKTLFESIKHYS